MKHVKCFTVGLALVAVATLAVMGCTGAGGTPPSSADAARAFAAMGSAVGAAPTGDEATYSGNTYTQTVFGASGGTILVSYSSFGDFNTGAASMTGTLTFTNLYEPATGYTFNGTVGITEATDRALNSFPLTITLGMTCNLTLTGGPISTLSCNISESMTFFPDRYTLTAFTASGTLTANGYTFDMTRL